MTGGLMHRYGGLPPSSNMPSSHWTFTSSPGGSRTHASRDTRSSGPRMTTGNRPGVGIMATPQTCNTLFDKAPTEAAKSSVKLYFAPLGGLWRSPQRGATLAALALVLLALVLFPFTLGPHLPF